MKKIVCISLIVLIALGSVFAQGAQEAPKANAQYKIGLITETVSQAEEAFRIAETLKEQNPNVVIHQTFPDKAASEQETTISNALSMAADPAVKAIIFQTANEGTAAAMNKVREVRPDILLMAGVPNEAPDVICAAADIVYHPDVVNMGLQVAEAAHKMGAKTLVFYSFPRHMAQPLNIARRQIMKETAEKYGITFVDGTTPDPMSDAGISGTQQFVLEDGPRKVEQYGKDTAFFGTNAGQQEPMCKAVYESGALYPMPDNPSVFYAFPGALGIEVPADKKGDIDFMRQAISDKLASKNMTGRMGVWTAPQHTMFMTTAFNYAKAYCEGKIGTKADLESFTKELSDYAGGEVSVRQYVDPSTNKKYDNFFVILGRYITL